MSAWPDSVWLKDLVNIRPAKPHDVAMECELSGMAHIYVIQSAYSRDEVIAIGEAIKAYGETMPEGK